MGFIKAKLMSIFNTFASDESKVTRLLYVILLIANPLIVWWHITAYPDCTIGTVTIELFVSLFTYMLREMSEYYAPTLGFPPLKTRLTRRLADSVYVRNDDVSTAIQYLADVEDWAQKHRLTK